jgi:Ca2+-binding EF-hand superfamily protein
MNKRLTVLLVAALALGATAAFAQEGKKDRAEKAKAEIEKRFNAADTDHDGKLSKDEAKAGMPKVYEHFDEMDSGKTGFVTLEQVKAEVGKMAAERRKSKG